MALNVHAAGYLGAGPTLAAPLASETIDVSSGAVLLVVVIGATATVVTVVIPGSDQYGSAKPDVASASLSNVTRVWRIEPSMADPTTGLVTVNFSNVTAVTASVVRL